MKFAAALASFVAISQAVTLESEADAAPGHAHVHYDDTTPYEGDAYYNNPGYVEPSYEHRYEETLPGADFNRHVYEFDNNKPVWDQNDYTERVKVEAEMLVALESLKESAMYLGYDLQELQDHIDYQRKQIGSNQDDIYENMEALIKEFDSQLARISGLQDNCHYSQQSLDDNRAALVLYCQQFAFAPEMVGPCKNIITGRQKRLPYRFHFNGSYTPSVPAKAKYVAAKTEPYVEAYVEPKKAYKPEPEPVYKPEPEVYHAESDYNPNSSHGIDIKKGASGDVEVAPGTHPELAAAAISHDKVVLQVDGKTIIAPMSEVDTDKVEVACDEDGCVLIPDDNNPHNDLIPDAPHKAHVHDVHDHSHDHGHAGHDVYPDGPYDGPYPDGPYDGPYPDGPYNDGHLASALHAHGAPHGGHGSVLDNHLNGAHPHNEVFGNGHIPSDAQLGPGYDMALNAGLAPPDAHYAPSAPVSHQAYDPAFDLAMAAGAMGGPNPGMAPGDYSLALGPPMGDGDSTHGQDATVKPPQPEEELEKYVDPLYDNSHGIALPVVGGNTEVRPGTDAELAAAAYDPDSCVIVHNGEAFLAPIDQINTDAVELACNHDGCALIQDDGDDSNDVILPGME